MSEKKEMTPRERFMKCLSFEHVDRIPVMDFGYWGETIDEWHKQGLPKDVVTTEDVERYFGLDRGFETNLVNYWGDYGPVGIQWRVWPEWEKTLVDEDDEHWFYSLGDGGELIESKTGSIPFQSKFPIETLDDFWAKIPSRTIPDDESRILPSLDGMIQRGIKEQQAFGVWIEGFFAWPRLLMGPENTLVSYYEDPELMHTINRQHLWFVKEFIDKLVLPRTKLDYAFITEDMCYNHGCMISPQTFDEFMKPYYLELVDFLHSRGMKKIIVDSDGNTVSLCDKLVEVGIDGHCPMEIKAGAYPEEIRKKHPKFAMIGGIDKLALAVDRAAIDKELAKLPPLLEQGGFIPALDHRVQPGVPMANYQYYIEEKRKLLEKYNS